MTPMVVLQRGARGTGVRDVQARLGALGYHVDPHEHGEFGPGTEAVVREFQQRRHLLVDGIVGDHTWAELVEAGYALGDRLLYLRYPSFRGDDVRALQARLNLLGFDAGREDGIFGDGTDRAVRDFQRNVGLPLDGIVGNTTLEALGRLRPVGPGPGRAEVREGESLLRLSGDLQRALIGIDPTTMGVRGVDHPPVRGPSGLSETDAALALARALVDELRGRGAEPILFGADHPSPEATARAANRMSLDLLIALRPNAHDDPAAEGATTFYFGREGYVSQAGHRLAELIQSEVTSQLGLKDGRTHPKALPLLRETRMPAVHVEPCFITNPREERLLASPSFRRQLAVAVADAVERYLGRSGVEGDPVPWSAATGPGAASAEAHRP